MIDLQSSNAMKRFLRSCGWLLLAGSLLFAQTADTKPSKWQIDDIVMSESASQFDLSPDGKWAVWVKQTADKDKDGHVSNLILSALTEKKEIELTRGTEHNNINPKWSPNGQLIAFVSTRPVPKPKSSELVPPSEGPKPQMWLFNPFGGEPWNLTAFERGVSNFQWLDDETILFAAAEDATQYEQAIKEKKDATIVVEDEAHTPPVRLFKLVIKDKKVTRLSSNQDWIQSFEISRDRTKVLVLHNRSLRYTYDQQVKPAVFLHDLKAGTSRMLFPDGKLLVAAITAARDADGFYLTTAYTTHPKYVMAAISLLHYYDPASDKAVPINLDWENGLASGPQATPDGFVALLANGARHRLARFVRAGANWRRAWIEGEQTNNAFAVRTGPDGRTLLYQYSTANTPAQWYRAGLTGERVQTPAQLTDLNAQFKTRVKAKTEIVRWPGANNDEIEGLLYFPHNYEAGKKYPLMLMIHGGPYGADFDAWQENWAYPTNLICERGAFVLKPNYHGSSNYGLKFGESIAGKYYELEVQDIEKGVDFLIAKGLVDANRLGTMGWSNGSILSIALTTFGPTPRKYKVLGAGAGDVEWTSDWGNAHFGASFDNYYFGKSPLEDPQLYIQKSPFFKLNKVRVPTIIFFGTQDTNVPTQQGWLHYRALQQEGETPVRFILFPGEPHSLQKLSHQRRKLEEELAWYDKHFFRTGQPDNEAFKKDSPLALVFKHAEFKKHGMHFGELIGGKLVPETVKYGDLKFEIGRFEITRAQFAAFDPNYKFEVGTENHPANGITFEQAQAYCAWLSKLTGQTYRLATMAEVSNLYDAAKTSENTLDYWAGYKVNPDDDAKLQLKLRQLAEKLSGEAPLLKPVGSFKGLGAEELLFDLGGNVAEWVVGNDGKGLALGGSADQPQDEKRAQPIPGPSYIGFRVVKSAGN
jgi:dipeptidyl aminopeptidase/acylaminoacyl peptidase